MVKGRMRISSESVLCAATCVLRASGWLWADTADVTCQPLLVLLLLHSASLLHELLRRRLRLTLTARVSLPPLWRWKLTS